MVVLAKKNLKRTILVGMSYSKLESGAFDTLIYSLGSVTTFSFNYKLNKRIGWCS